MKKSAKSAQSKSELQLEIGHVLFIDIVGYSKLLINEQTEAMKILNEVVRSCACFRKADAAGQLIRLPTGDGMALVFLDHVEAPAQCALEISGLLQREAKFGVRMGVHSGPVNQVADINGRLNLTGAGIDMGCRVMDCGDAGHILLSKRVADDLAPYRQWQPRLHDLGEVKVKHDVMLGIANLYTDEVGNPACPKKIQEDRGRAKFSRPILWTLAAVAVIGALLLGYFFLRPNEKITEKIPEKSIAILPFQNLSNDPANAYFVQGIRDEIITRLTTVADLKLISRTSTDQYLTPARNLPLIAKQLGVANIMEGTVQRSGELVHINVQLIHAVTDSHLWAQSYDRELTNIFAVESEVATAIAQKLQLQLTGREAQALALKVKLTDNSEAYNAYLHGLSYEGHFGFTLESLQEKVKAYGKAVEIDPHFVQAWAQLASANAWMYFSFDPTSERLMKARDALNHAKRLAPEVEEVVMADGNVCYAQRDYKGALEAYLKTAAVLPNNAEVQMRIGGVTRRLGRWEEALTFHTRAVQLDPLNVEVWKHQGWTLRGLRRYSEAVEAFDHALQVAPGDAELISEKATTYQMQGDLPAGAKVFDTLPPDADRHQSIPWRLNQWVDERKFAPAIAALQSSLAKRAEFSKSQVAEILLNLGSVHLLNGERDIGLPYLTEARDLMAEVRREGADNPFSTLSFGAEISSLLGDHASALREVEGAAATLASDALLYPQALTALARIHTEAGEIDAAIATLTPVLQMKCAFGATPGLLRVEPVWDPLRKDPRFQKLLE